MESFWKATVVILVTVIFGVTIEKTAKEISVVLTITACCIVMVIAVHYLSDIVGYLWELGNAFSELNGFMEILLRISGVALLTELTGLISCDAGNNALGKAIQILGNTAILFLSLPLFKAFFTIIQEIMETL